MGEIPQLRFQVMGLLPRPRKPDPREIWKVVNPIRPPKEEIGMTVEQAVQQALEVFSGAEEVKKN